MAPLPLIKVFSVFAKQISKPVSSRLQTLAQTYEPVRQQCLWIGQSLEWASWRLIRISSGRGNWHSIIAAAPCYAVTNQGVPSEPMAYLMPGQRVEVLRAGSTGHAGVPPALSAWGVWNWRHVRWHESGELRQGWAPAVTQTGEAVMGIKPMGETEAVKRGSSFLGEAFVFGVAALLVIYEVSVSNAGAARKSAAAAEAKDMRRKQKLDVLAARQKEADDRNTELLAKIGALDEDMRLLRHRVSGGGDGGGSSSEALRLASPFIAAAALTPLVMLVMGRSFDE